MADEKVTPPATVPTSGGATGNEGNPPGNQGGDQGLLGSVLDQQNPPKQETPPTGTAVERAKEEEAARVAQEQKVKDEAAAKAKAETDAKTKEESDKKALADAAKKAAEELEAKKPTLEKLKFPENTLISKERANEIVADAMKNGKTAEDAQKQLDSEHAIASRILSEGQNRLKAQGDKWRTEIQSDPELGGTNFKETDRLYTKAVKTVFGDEIIPELKALGVESHPKFVKGMVKLAKSMEASPLVIGEKPPAGKDLKPKTPAQLAYNYDEAHPYDANKAAVDTAAGVAPRGMR